MYTLDTNVIVYVMSPEAYSTDADQIFREADRVFLSVITELELFSYPRLTADEAADRKYDSRFFGCPA